jgi:mannose-6-phosphate isomerase
MDHHRHELLGRAASPNGRFPLLVKILDAEDRLSLQVHPPAAKAAALGGEPKTEMWYITHAQPGAMLYVGLKRGVTAANFEERLKDGSVAECFHQVPVQAGDAMFLPSGRVHAIGAGLVIFEIQQNSDTTYRVFDWNRTDAEGKPRQLHVAESLQCIDFDDTEPQSVRGQHKLVDDPLFTVETQRVAGELRRLIDRPHTIAVVQGAAEINQTLKMNPGEFCLLPACLGEMRIRSPKGMDTVVLIAAPGAQAA